MSGKVTGWVLEHSPVTGVARMVLVVLADHADSDGCNAWPSVPRIAHEARCSGSSVHRVLRELEAAGHVVREGVGPKGSIRYRVAMTPPTIGGVRPSEGSDLVPDTPPTIGPEPSIEPPTTALSVGARAKERAHTFNGQPVDRALAADAERALAHYAQRTEQGVVPFDGRGRTSESMKRIVGAMLAHPSLRTNFVRVIDCTLRSGWWGDGPPSVGVIFGPNVVEREIARATTPPRIGHTRANGGRDKHNGAGAGDAALIREMRLEMEARR